MTNPTDKEIALAQGVLDAMTGPRCQGCSGVRLWNGDQLTPKWAGEEYGWCECAQYCRRCGEQHTTGPCYSYGQLAYAREQAQFFAEYQNE